MNNINFFFYRCACSQHEQGLVIERPTLPIVGCAGLTLSHSGSNYAVMNPFEQQDGFSVKIIYKQVFKIF